MAEIMTTKELAEYLKLHEVTISKYAAKGLIPAIRIGRVWRFDKKAIDEWIRRGQKKPQDANKSRSKATPTKPRKKQLPRKRKGKRN